MAGGRRVVDAVTFDVGRGEIVGLVGENGAGKTSLFRMILGLRRPADGRILLFGEPAPPRPQTLARIGAIVEEPAFYPWLTGEGNLRTFALVGAPVTGTAIADALALVGLTTAARQRVKAYSQGMRQRLGLALALLRNPKLLVLDEPTNGLDPPGIRDLRELLLQLRDRGVAVLVASHLLDEVARTCDRVLLMARGRLIAARAGGDIDAAETLEDWFMAVAAGREG